MRPARIAKIRALSLAHLYLTDATPGEVAALPPHPMWHAPFMLADAGEPFEQLADRVARAGSLWLTNYDLRPCNELVIEHVDHPWVVIFQRAERPDEGHLEVGPFAVHALMPGEGGLLPRVPFRYVENAQASDRERWRQQARRAR